LVSLETDASRETVTRALGRPQLAVMPAKAGIFLAVAGTTLWLSSMPRRQKMPAFAGMTAYSRA
jgi:hypothetical protein